jgi:uncharacterized protein (TIGR00251 family)
VGNGFLSASGTGVLIELRVSPGAKRTGFKGLYGEDALWLAVDAPPVDGRANTEVERLLAQTLGVPKSGVTVVRGGSGRSKRVAVSGVTLEEARKVLPGS